MILKGAWGNGSVRLCIILGSGLVERAKWLFSSGRLYRGALILRSVVELKWAELCSRVGIKSEARAFCECVISEVS